MFFSYKKNEIDKSLKIPLFIRTYSLHQAIKVLRNLFRFAFTKRTINILDGKHAVYSTE